MSDHEKLEELKEQLEAYCEYENDEHGEMVRYLCHLSDYSYMMDKDFIDALTTQMKSELENYLEYCTLVESEETYTRKYIELEWNV